MIKKKITLFLILYLLVFIGCSQGYEVTMPFKNISYSGERLFPVQLNDSEKMFRAWINTAHQLIK
jgi:PBP1b-binding outer membrane lipoprotein LpoB